MRRCLLWCRQLASSQKFYDLVNTNQKRILPKTAEEIIISKYLKDELPTSPKINNNVDNSTKS